MSNRRDFLKKLGFSALIPIVPKLPITESNVIKPNLLEGKIKTGGLLAHIEENKQTLTFGVDGPERMRLYSGKDYMTRFNMMYEDALWKGNPITDKKK
jgi:hypothetical protein